jgi:signal transduction histidine kinase
VEKAIPIFKEQGVQPALKAINDPKGPFVKGEMYIFALSMDNVMLAHPHEYSIRRMNVNNVKDSSGTPLFQKFKEVVEKDSKGWVDYMWGKPGAAQPSRKRSFVQRVPGENIYIGCGYYAD